LMHGKKKKKCSRIKRSKNTQRCKSRQFRP
jgi:hypothetical protein